MTVHSGYWSNQTNNQSIIPSTDMIQLTLTLKMTTTRVVETSVTVNNNSPIQDYVHPDDKTQVIFLKLCIKYAELSLRAEVIFLSQGVVKMKFRNNFFNLG